MNIKLRFQAPVEWGAMDVNWVAKSDDRDFFSSVDLFTTFGIRSEEYGHSDSFGSLGQ